ncbi:MAG: Maf family protein [Acidiferrobacteraceae bacterium]
MWGDRAARALVLASTSRYRKELLARLGLPFETDMPDVDERAAADEPAATLVRRLSIAKALAVAPRHPHALVIGSDQAAVYDGLRVGKPDGLDAAAAQLRRISGKTAILYTGIALLDTDSGRIQADVVPFRVVFRVLTDTQINRYLEREQPFDCAGSVKSEGLGIALFERFDGGDPTALIGLPLIRLVAMLEDAGVTVV